MSVPADAFNLITLLSQFILPFNFLAIVWQLMRAYTLSILQKIAKDSGEENPAPVTDEKVVAWANEKVGLSAYIL